MDSASPSDASIASQLPSTDGSSNTFFARNGKLAAFAFAFDWLAGTARARRYRDADHPPATGDGRPL